MEDITTSSTMTAYRYHPGIAEPVLETLPIPTPGPNEVLVKILAAGVCGSDTSALKNSYFQNTFTMGHEGAGVVHSLGPFVSETYHELEQGTYVAIVSGNGCFESSCALCSSGRDNLCTVYPWYGLGCNGSWASFCIVRAACLVVVPGDTSSIPPSVVAVATDAVLTPYHALKTGARVQPGQTVLINGCGGLGHNAIQIAKNCLGASCVIACDIRESSLRLATESGADYAIHPDKLEDLMRDRQLRIDVAADFVGNQKSFDTVQSAVPCSATIVIIGLGAKTIELPILLSAQKDLTIKLCFWGYKSELKEILDAIADGKLKPHVETRPMDECAEVLKDMKAGKLKARVAMVP